MDKSFIEEIERSANSFQKTLDILEERNALTHQSQKAAIDTAKSNEWLLQLARNAAKHADNSLKQAQQAKRHAIWANVISIIIFGTSIYISLWR